MASLAALQVSHFQDCTQAAAAEPAPVSDGACIQTKAYAAWLDLVQGDEIPAVEDAFSPKLHDISADGAMFDLTMGMNRAVIASMGSTLARDVGSNLNGQSIKDIPANDRIVHLTENFVAAVANRAPVGFAFDAIDRDGRPIACRSIHLPFSSNGTTVDFVFSVIETAPRVSN